MQHCIWVHILQVRDFPGTGKASYLGFPPRREGLFSFRTRTFVFLFMLDEVFALKVIYGIVKVYIDTDTKKLSFASVRRC